MARDFPLKVEDDALARANGRCEGCGGALKPGRFQYDHIKPHAMGGASDLANCQVLCTACHIAKSQTDDMPSINRADRKGKVKRGLIVSAGVSEIARRFR